MKSGCLFEQLGIVILEDAPVVSTIAGVQRFDQAVDPRCHHEQVAGGVRGGIPVGVGCSTRDEQRVAGAELALRLSDAKAEGASEDDSCLVV